MDPTQDGSGAGGQNAAAPDGQPPYGQPPYAQPTYGQDQGSVVPMPGGWAAGVTPMPVIRRSRKRWAIAGAVVLCVALATVGGAFVLSGAVGSKSLTAGVAPKDTLVFMELRTDLPGDQHAKLADFMSHFPGFADRSQFDNALDELLNRLTSSVSPDLTYTSAFKPWMEGEVSIAVSGLAGFGMADSGSPPAPADTSGLSTVAQPQRAGSSAGYAVAIFALKDRTAAQGWLASELTRQGLSATSQDYAGTTLYTLGSSQGSYLATGSYAFTDQDLILGTTDGVKAALDTKTNGSLADNADYQAAMKALSGDSLARFYVDARAYMTYLRQSFHGALSLPGVSSVATFPLSGADVPAWIAGSIQADSGDMVVNVAMPRSGDSAAANHISALASALPGGTVGVVEVHAIGKLITSALATAQAQASGNSELSTLSGELAAIGGVDWLGDGVAVVTKDGATYGGGLVVQATDAATASAKVALVGNLLALGGSSYQISTHTDSYKGTSITVIDLPASLTGTATQIALAAKDNLIVGGYAETFVKAVLDTTSSSSLASQSDYSAVMAAAGSSNGGSFYVDIPALEDTIGQSLFQADPSAWTSNYKPYFDHLGGVGFAVVDGTTVMLRFVVTAR
jgi:Protein of unknown function (DUF3352)